MRRLLLGCLLIVFTLMLFSFGSAFAQERDEDSWRAYRPYDLDPTLVADREGTITCESQRGRSNYCRTGMRGDVRLRRQLSERPCREYDTWGADRDGSGVWVADGCRGVFVVESRRRRDDWEPPSGGERTITCESRSGRYNYCRTGTEGYVQLQRQLSDTPCQEHYTWGADRDGGGVWVADGCRGVFVVEARRPPRPDWRSERTRGERIITCKSEHYDYNHCRVDRRGEVRLERQLSDTRCTRGDNWGVDRNGIWVDRGCAAEFSID